MHNKDSSSIEKHHFKPIGLFYKDKLRGRITSTERHNDTALAYECFFLRLLSKGLILLVIFACINSSRIVLGPFQLIHNSRAYLVQRFASERSV